jgi:hypothetical protein
LGHHSKPVGVRMWLVGQKGHHITGDLICRERCAAILAD